MRQGYRVIDVDTHLTEPPDVWTARVPSALHDQVPHVERRDGRDVWVADGNVIGAPGFYSMAGYDGVLPAQVPATYDEPKGMFLLESMAAGAPVVQPRRGAFTEVVEKTGGGLLVAPDDVDALAEGLHRVWSDRALSASLAEKAFHGVRAHYTIEQSAIRQVEVYESAVRRANTGLPC